MDYSTALANERTVLAYMRTALALDAAALAVARFLNIGPPWLTLSLAVLLALAGLWTGIVAIVRFRQVQTAMESAEPLPPTKVPVVLAVTLAVCSILALLLAIA